MESLFRYVAAPSTCGYLPDRLWSLEYEYVGELTAAEYLERMVQGWRRFGMTLFRPVCGDCRACRALRVPVATFRPDRSQRRAWKANCGSVGLRIGKPAVSPEKLALHDRFHAHQHVARGWPRPIKGDAAGYADCFVHHPFATEEWAYYLDGRLIGVGYVDRLPTAPAPPQPDELLPGGLSAIYFFYDPVERHRSLGTYNVLSLIDRARQLGLPYVYLGYYVAGCPSMEYKARFRPHEIRGEEGEWQ